jgi:cytoskeleton protein RodZ
MTDNAPLNPTEDTNDFHTDLAVGEILRRARLQLNKTQQDVNRDLRFSSHIIDALEKSEFQKLPGQVYIIGFVKTYADYLGLDGEKLVVLLKEQAKIQTERPVYHFPNITRDRIAPPTWVLISSGVALIIILMLWSLVSHSSSEHTIPSVPATLSAQLTVPEKPKPQPQPQKNIISEDEGQIITTTSEPAIPKTVASQATAVKAIQDCWIDVRNDQNETIFSRVLKQGEEFWVPADGKQYTLTAGNAGGVVIQKAGIESAPLGKVGEVIRNYRVQ